MKIHRTLVTKMLNLDIVIQTTDGLSHARMTNLTNSYADAVNKGLDKMLEEMMFVENLHTERLQNVGK